jgi:hypothetical protein
MLFKDLYGAFKLPVDKNSGEGEGNFAITLVLLCIIDGISVNIYPTKHVKDQEKRFKRLIREKLYWGTTKNGWLDKGLAAKQLYLEIRNPLVHELGADKVTSARIPGHLEPRIGKWGTIEKSHNDIDLIDGLQSWNDNWPALTIISGQGGKYIKFSAAALYWSVKKMVIDLINNKDIMQNAMSYLDGVGASSTNKTFFERMPRWLHHYLNKAVPL